MSNNPIRPLKLPAFCIIFTSLQEKASFTNPETLTRLNLCSCANHPRIAVRHKFGNCWVQGGSEPLMLKGWTPSLRVCAQPSTLKSAMMTALRK